MILKESLVAKDKREKNKSPELGKLGKVLDAFAGVVFGSEEESKNEMKKRLEQGGLRWTMESLVLGGFSRDEMEKIMKALLKTENIDDEQRSLLQKKLENPIFVDYIRSRFASWKGTAIGVEMIENGGYATKQKESSVPGIEEVKEATPIFVQGVLEFPSSK